MLRIGELIFLSLRMTDTGVGQNLAHGEDSLSSESCYDDFFFHISV